MPQAHHYIHAGGPQYAPPVLRAASPSSSIGTAYGDDDTSLPDRELSREEFDKRCEERLGLHQRRGEEVLADLDPRLPRPKTAIEEKAMFEFVMKNLRDKVRQLEEDELFEQTMLRGTQIGREQQPSSDNVDVIMRGLMGPSTGSQSTAHFSMRTDNTGPPWSASMTQNSHRATGGTDYSATTMGIHSTRA